jgi:hypothetical protein
LNSSKKGTICWVHGRHYVSELLLSTVGQEPRTVEPKGFATWPEIVYTVLEVLLEFAIEASNTLGEHHVGPFACLHIGFFGIYFTSGFEI